MFSEVAYKISNPFDAQYQVIKPDCESEEVSKKKRKKKNDLKTDLDFPKIEVNDPVLTKITELCGVCMGEFKLEKNEVADVVRKVNAKG